MRFPTVAFVCGILVSVFAVSQSGVISDAAVDQVASYSIIDPIIKAILEKLRPILSDLKINDVREIIKQPTLNGTVNVKDIMIKNLDKFVVEVLKSDLLPLRLSNLTLTWNKLTVTAGYDVDLLFGVPQLNSPIRLFAKGDASVVIDRLFFTIGAKIEMKNKTIQIKRKGLFGFDLSLKGVKVTLSSLMGSTEFGSSAGAFLSKTIPELVDVLKKPVFDVFQDDIIRIVNDFLKSNKQSFALDDIQDLEELSLYDAAGEIDSSFGHPLALGEDLEDNELNFNF